MFRILFHNYYDACICFKGKRALFWFEETNVSSPHHHSNVCVRTYVCARVHACKRARMHAGWCLCGCVRIWVFTQLEEQSRITSPSGSWGVCCHPIKRQTGSGTRSRNPEDFTCWNIPTFELKGQARSLQAGWLYLEKGGRERMRLSL